MPDRVPSTLALDTTGVASGAALVLIHTLGTDRSLWVALLPHLPTDLCVVRLDLPGHGQSPVGPPPGRIGALISAVEATLDAHAIRDAAILGHGLGGLIAQGLAVKRLDQVRALILSGTAAKIGTRAQWDHLATALRQQGHSALIDGPAATWSSKRAAPDQMADLARLLRQQPLEGLAQAAEAIAGTDFYTATASLRLPVLGLVGSDDRFSPPDLVRETTDLVPGSRMTLIPRAGHLAMRDMPGVYGEKVAEFLRDVGHGQATSET